MQCLLLLDDEEFAAFKLGKHFRVPETGLPTSIGRLRVPSIKDEIPLLPAPKKQKRKFKRGKFPCQIIHCTRVFKTKMGEAVHRASAHKGMRNEQKAS